jgi:glycosyltransferase involved in cell wall biosynthesis
MFFLHLSPFVVANSEAGMQANRLKPSDNRYVLYNGIDNKFDEGHIFRSERLRQKLDITQSTFVIVSVANFVPYKDYFTVLHALKSLTDKRPNFQYVYVALGDGPLRRRVIDLGKELGIDLHLRILGQVDNVEDYLGLGSIFVHSSRGEGCSNAILEAMKCGLPIVASDTGGTPEILDRSYGELFIYGNAMDLLNKMEKVIFERDLVSMAKTSKSAANERFSVDTVTNNFDTIMQEILRRSRR